MVRTLRTNISLLIWLTASLACHANETATEPPDAGRPLSGEWLTTDGLIKRDPVYWPGTSFIVFSVEDPRDGVLRLVKMDVNTKKQTPLLENNPDSTREFTTSADGKVYAYNTVSGLSSKITVVDQETGVQTKLPGMGRATWSNWSTISPDGKRVLFVEGAHTIFEYDLVTNQGKRSVRKISQNAEYQSDYWPRYSPNGDAVTFASNRSGDFEIYTMSANGLGTKRITNKRGIDMHPVFSPDGSHIAFTSNRDGNYEIYVMSAAGGSARRITMNPERDDFACWHPGGKQLLLVSEHKGQFDLRLITVTR